MTASDESQRSRWNGARNRDRNQARFLIKELVAASLNSTGNDDIIVPTRTSIGTAGVQDEEEIRSFFRNISMKSSCSFSLKVVAKNHSTLSMPLPARFMSEYKIKTLCTSRFGVAFGDAALEYSKLVSRVTLIEYAALVGEYGAITQLLAGGINPCYFHMESLDREQAYEYTEESITRKRDSVRKLVMKKLVVDYVPRSLVGYIIRSIFAMKMWSIVRANEKIDIACQKCSVSSEKEQLIVFDGSCKHVCCEVCLWESVAKNLDKRGQGDVVRCPICSESSTSTDLEREEREDPFDKLSPQERFNLSLSKFEALPQTVAELRKLPKKRKANKAIHSTWDGALKTSIGNSQDVRTDKFMRYVGSGFIHHCRACLRDGIDVNKRNEYNQTPLHIACWRNHAPLVSMLLEFGADPRIHSNGNISALNIAKENNYVEIIGILEKYLLNDDSPTVQEKITALMQTPSLATTQVTPRSVHILIPQNDDHIGAGSFFIDNALPQNILRFLDGLFESLPIAPPTEAANKKKKAQKAIPCSTRYYFCDSEAYLSSTIARHIESTLNSSDTSQPVKVEMFHQMRFLCYDEVGSALAPHIDLAKIDPVKPGNKRSTHTFILYLRDCEKGGETALLKELSPHGPLASHEVLAMVGVRRGRILLFPHACPHEGKSTLSLPKIILRGEVIIEEKRA